MLEKRLQITCKVGLAAADSNGRAVPQERGLIVHRFKTRKHEGRGEPLAVDLAVELICRLNDSEPLEPQRQPLVAQLALIHRRHDEFPCLVLPLFVGLFRLRSRIRSFAHNLSSSSFGLLRLLRVLNRTILFQQEPAQSLSWSISRDTHAEYR